MKQISKRDEAPHFEHNSNDTLVVIYSEPDAGYWEGQIVASGVFIPTKGEVAMDALDNLVARARRALAANPTEAHRKALQCAEEARNAWPVPGADWS